ncbi:hypothetical protein OH809_11495 [Streptomyces sp. NBC_00873]|nr:hypothetical protein OH809_11495 [Streptomyces sp. NBC_00873]WTA46731.1 hypothetical protein OH821_32310 [Streptomyces sp. NBC_00842]
MTFIKHGLMVRGMASHAHEHPDELRERAARKLRTTGRPVPHVAGGFGRL